jgi:Ca2+:H+ antiporter
VFAAVHHAEVLALKLGEPFGSILLALAVTVIEVALIVSIMLSGAEGSEAVARDTVFSAVMIVLNGVIGLCLVLGGQRHFEQTFRQQGASAALAVVGTLAVLTLILPNYTVAVSGPIYSPAQLVVVAILSLVLWGVFVFVQTVKHRDYFLDDPEMPERAAVTAAARPRIEASGSTSTPSHGGGAVPADAAPTDEAAVDTLPSEAPTDRVARICFALLLLSLTAVVLLAKVLSKPLDQAIEWAGLPQAFVGVVIAAIVLLPESIAAATSALRNRLQNSINLAVGSAIASIGLTVPTVAVLSIMLDKPLVLGISPASTVLLVLTLFMSTLTLGTGRTSVLQGSIHLVIFAAFLLVSAVP